MSGAFTPQGLFDAGVATGRRAERNAMQARQQAALDEVAAIRQKWETFVFNSSALDRLERIIKGQEL